MKPTKKFLIYFPVTLVGLQVIFNLYALVNKAGYDSIGFYLNTFIGTNVFFALFLLAFTFCFNFCAISKWCAIAEVLFAGNYLIIQQDNLYNILFQVIVGVISLIITSRYFIKKFPLCKISLIAMFFASILSTKSCSKGIAKFESIVKETYGNNQNNRTYT